MRREGKRRACDNAVLTEMLSNIVARCSLVTSLYEEERNDDCESQDLTEVQELMYHDLAVIEARVRLSKGQGRPAYVPDGVG